MDYKYAKQRGSQTKSSFFKERIFGKTNQENRGKKKKKTAQKAHEELKKGYHLTQMLK